MLYRVKSQIRMDGAIYAPGSTIELEAALALKIAHAVEELDRPESEPKEMPRPADKIPWKDIGKLAEPEPEKRSYKFQKKQR